MGRITAPKGFPTISISFSQRNPWEIQIFPSLSVMVTSKGLVNTVVLQLVDHVFQILDAGSQGPRHGVCWPKIHTDMCIIVTCMANMW